jgi:pilus assembly protein CpaC
MSSNSTAWTVVAISAVTFAWSTAAAPKLAHAQHASFASQTANFKIKEAYHRLEIISTTSKLLTMDFDVPRMSVDNPEIIQVQPLSTNQIQISARKPGVTNLKMWDKAGKVYLVDVIVFGDARELENLLISEFPQASLRVRPLASSVVISGFVPNAEMVGQIVSMAEDYYPKVINKIDVGGAQQILLHVKVMEVSRTRLRKLGFDWAFFNGNDAVISRAAGLVGTGLTAAASSGGETLAFGVVDNAGSFFGFMEALRQNNLAKVLAEPTLVTVSGRPASFQSGGELPILVPQSLGTFSIEYKEIGTRVDFVPLVLANGHIRLEIRPMVSEVDPSRSVTIQNVTIPGIRNRWVDTGVEMRAGQTLALAGLVQTRVETERMGLPWLSEMPWIGTLFGRIEEVENEIELVITVTPQFASAMDPHEVPPCGPGGFTRSPTDIELYGRRYLEVPKCCVDGSCPNCVNGSGHALPGFSAPVDGPHRAVPLPLESQQDGASDSVNYAPLRNPFGHAETENAAARPPHRRVESGLIGPQGYDVVR